MRVKAYRIVSIADAAALAIVPAVVSAVVRAPAVANAVAGDRALATVNVSMSMKGVSSCKSI